MKITSLSVVVAAAIVAAVLFVPGKGGAQVRGGSAPVTVVNTPLPVALEGTPAQTVLRGAFEEGSFNLAETILGPQSYTIPAGFSRLLLRHVSCEAIVQSGRKVQIFLRPTSPSPVPARRKT